MARFVHIATKANPCYRQLISALNLTQKDKSMNEQVRYVGFWARFIATILDNIWMAIVVLGLLWLVIDTELFSAESGATFITFFILYILPFLIVIFFWILKAATPAKMLFNMKIVDAKTFMPVSTPRLILRYIAYYVSLFSLGLGFIWVAFDKKSKSFTIKLPEQ